MFEEVGLPLVRRVVAHGEDATLLLYGQTGAGKTFTFFGDWNERAGLVPRMCSTLMGMLGAMNKESLVTAACF